MKNFTLCASNNELGPEIGENFAEIFQMNQESTSLEELILDNNEFGIKGVKGVLKGVALSKTLKKL